MGDIKLPDPPDVTSLVPRMMTATELQKSLELLFDWLHIADASPDLGVAEQASVQKVRDAVNLLLSERRERHSDESGFRGR